MKPPVGEEVNTDILAWEQEFERIQAHLGPNAHRRWLHHHKNRVRRICKQVYGEHDWQDSFEELYAVNPKKLRAIVEALSRDPSEAYESFVDYLARGESTIGMVEGGRGEGKSTSVGIVAADLSKRGRLIDYLGMQSSIPIWPNDYGPPAKQIHDTSEARSGSIVILDESAQMYNSRNSSSRSGRAIVSQLARLRHSRRSAIVVTQDSSMTDVAFSKMLDYVWFKPLGFNTQNYSRGEYRSFYERWWELLPRTKSENFVFGKRIPPTRFYRRIPAPWWKEEWSRSYEDFTSTEAALEMAYMLREKGMDYKAIAQQMYSMGSRFDEKLWEALIVDRNGGKDPLHEKLGLSGEAVAMLRGKGKGRRVDAPREEDIA